MIADINYHTLDTFSEIMDFGDHVSLSTVCAEGHVEGRQVGWQRKQYMDNTKQVTQMTISQFVRTAEDHNRWKQVVSQMMMANDQT